MSIQGFQFEGDSTLYKYDYNALDNKLELDDTLEDGNKAANAEKVGDELATKANIDGYYEDLTSGNAEQIVSTQYLEDKIPYHFRTSGGSLDIGNREEAMLIGGSIVWNQLMPSLSGTGTVEGITLTHNGDGSVTISGTSTARSNIIIMTVTESNKKLIKNHVYYMKGSPSGGSNLTYYTGIAGLVIDTGNGGLFRHKYDWTSSNFRLDFYSDVTFDNVKVYPQYYDLTKMFGTEIADAVYAMEQAEAGAGVAWFKKLFPNDYYEYNAGELMHVEGVSAHEMRDASNNLIKSYPLDNSLTLRGIPKIDVGGNLYYDGDTYESDGTVTRKYGIVDLGTLNWTYMTDYLRFQSTILDIVSNVTVRTVNMICSKYVAITDGRAIGNVGDKCIYGAGNNKYIYVHDSAYTDAASFKAAMSGVYLVYELATPTTETAQPYQNPQIVDNRGTEEYVTDSIVPVGHYTKYPANLRDKIQHLPDLASDEGNYIINQQGQKMTLVRFRIPSAPSKDGTYILRATVSNGTPTYTWESEASDEG